MSLLEMITALCGAFGPTGDEGEAVHVAEGLLRARCDRVERFRGGSLVGYIGDDETLPLIALDAHLDEIGMVVTAVTDDGFVKFQATGGVDVRVLPAAEVLIHGREKIPGVIPTLPPHLKEQDNRFLKITELVIDIGMDKAEAEALISPGDRIGFAGSVRELQNGRITGKALDNRIGVAAVLLAAERLTSAPLPCRVAVVLSAGEESHQVGAETAAFALKPDLAYVVDTSFAVANGVPPEKAGVLGAGPMIGWAPILSRSAFEQLKTLAKRGGIPHQLEIMGGRTGTNADSFAASGAGVPCGLLSIPIRNMHMPVEVAELSDIEATADLLIRAVMATGEVLS